MVNRVRRSSVTVMRSATHKRASHACTIALLVGLLPLLANCAPPGDFKHNLVLCQPSMGKTVPVVLSPGLTCSDATNTFTLKMTAKTGNQVDNCAAAAAPWDTWAAGKMGSKIAATDAATIAKADIIFTGKTLASCSSTDPNSYPAVAGKGTIKFYAVDGTTKVKNGSASFVANLAAPGLLTGVVTKGVGAGATIEIGLGFDINDPANALMIACNNAEACPPDPFGKNSACTAANVPTQCCTGNKTGTCSPPIKTFNLQTAAGSYIRVQIPSNADCTGAGQPLMCCTGAGTGTCLS